MMIANNNTRYDNTTGNDYLIITDNTNNNDDLEDPLILQLVTNDDDTDDQEHRDIIGNHTGSFNNELQRPLLLASSDEDNGHQEQQQQILMLNEYVQMLGRMVHWFMVPLFLLHFGLNVAIYKFSVSNLFYGHYIPAILLIHLFIILFYYYYFIISKNNNHTNRDGTIRVSNGDDFGVANEQQQQPWIRRLSMMLLKGKYQWVSNNDSVNNNYTERQLFVFDYLKLLSITLGYAFVFIITFFSEDLCYYIRDDLEYNMCEIGYTLDILILMFPQILTTLMFYWLLKKYFSKILRRNNDGSIFNNVELAINVV